MGGELLGPSHGLEALPLAGGGTVRVRPLTMQTGTLTSLYLLPYTFKQCCGMFLDLPDPLIRGTDRDHSIMKQN